MLIYESTDRGDGITELALVDMSRLAEHLGEIGKTKQKKKTGGDLSVTSTGFTDVADVSVTTTTKANAKLSISLLAYGKAPVGQEMRLTLVLDGTNMGGAGGLAWTEQDKVGCLNAQGLSSALSAGSHTVKLQAKVTSGTGTIYADATNSVPLVLSVFVIEGAG